MKYILLFAFIALCSCSTTSGLSSHYINVEEDYPEKEFFSSYACVRLSPSTPMISEICDLRISDDKMFVSDKTSKVFVFTMKGDFLNVLDKRGRGPNEYIEISDFDIDNDKIYVLSRPQKRVYVYSSDCHHLDTYELNDYYNGLRILSDGNLCLASANCNDQQYNYLIYDVRTKTYTNRYLPFSRNESMLVSCYHPFLGRAGDTLYINNPYSTVITELCGKEIGWTKSYSFNTKKQLPDMPSDYTFEQLHKDYANKRTVRNLSLYCRTDAYEYIGYELFGEYGLSFYLTQIDKTDASKTMMSLNDIDKNFPYLSLPCSVKGKSLVSAMSASRILNLEKNGKLSKFKSEGLQDSDNPVVFIHHLK